MDKSESVSIPSTKFIIMPNIIFVLLCRYVLVQQITALFLLPANNQVRTILLLYYEYIEFHNNSEIMNYNIN